MSQPSVVSVFFCGRRERVNCSSTGCTANASLVCAHPVKRKGQDDTCRRPVCIGCAVLVDGNVVCAAHGRAAKAAGR